MASLASSSVLLNLLFIVSALHLGAAAARILSEKEDQQQLQFQYHKGPLLSGNISVNLIWYGSFKPSQRAIISDFITSLSSSPKSTAQPSVATWWKGTEKYYQLIKSAPKPSLTLALGAQILDENYSLGKSLTTDNIVSLASKGSPKEVINVDLTSLDVTVEGFCSSRCGTHASSADHHKFAYGVIRILHCAPSIF